MDVKRTTLLAAGAILLLATGGHAASASAPAGRVEGAAVPLAGCEVTFVPDVGSEVGRTCLTPATRTGPAVAAEACSFAYYENGPYGSPEWDAGWSVCVTGGPGTHYVPLDLNDQASSWDSCASGTFFAGQPDTDPRQGMPGFSRGNFPWGAVPNDSLSSAYVNRTC
ncbi:hypothetical protein [Umezawaea sp.]|uniref:hypothetical protein n=1 Tax=Umezawaea sp. TaxID=1955258 RepID=UPI002ED364BE